MLTDIYLSVLAKVVSKINCNVTRFWIVTNNIAMIHAIDKFFYDPLGPSR